MMKLTTAALLASVMMTATWAWADEAATATSAPATTPATSTAPATQSAFKTQKERISYIFGLQAGAQGKQMGMDMDWEVVVKGMQDGQTGKLAMSKEEIHATIQAFQKEMADKQMAEMHAAAEKNKKAGETFLADNGKKEGIKTLPSGLQYKVLKSGTGKTPKAEDTVKANYKGTLTDGTEFDASEPGKPATFQVGGVIPGWTEALKMMKEGDKWQLFVPSELAYGKMGTPDGAIGPNSTLVFEVELVEVKGAANK